MLRIEATSKKSAAKAAIKHWGLTKVNNDIVDEQVVTPQWNYTTSKILRLRDGTELLYHKIEAGGPTVLREDFVPPAPAELGELAIDIGRDAFLAGWGAAVRYANEQGHGAMFNDKAVIAFREQAWGDYDPPEELKGR